MSEIEEKNIILKKGTLFNSWDLNKEMISLILEATYNIKGVSYELDTYTRTVASKGIVLLENLEDNDFEYRVISAITVWDIPGQTMARTQRICDSIIKELFIGQLSSFA